MTFASNWNSGTGPIYLVEGPSDVAALRTIGLAVVGRPSNRAGVDYLSDLLFDIPWHREIVVVGERDQKSDGRWPGREGAISVATQLAERLERPTGWTLPPDEAKDGRAWLQSMPKLPIDRLAELFATSLEVAKIIVSTRLAAHPGPTIYLPLEEWRGIMRQARLGSLDHPGIYLDRSPTGAGKSQADFAAVQALLQREAA